MQNTFPSWQKYFLLFSFFSLAALSCLAPMAANTNLVDSPDLPNHLAAIAQAKLGILSGQLPLRFAPLEYDGMFYPLFQLSSPTSYTVAGFIHALLTPNNPLLAYKILIWFSLTLGGIYLYRAICLLIPSKPAALLASFAYLTSPFCLIITNLTGAFNGVIALGIMPIILFYNLQLLKYSKLQSWLLTILSWYLLITTHIISFIYFSIFLNLFLIFIIHDWKKLLNIVSAYFFGCILASWYLIPCLSLNKFLRIQRTITTLYDNYHVSLGNLLSSNLLSSLLSNANFQNTNSSLDPAIGWPFLLAAAVGTFAWLKQTSDKLLVPLLTLFYLTFFAVWSPINFWQYLPNVLSVGQFSWRLLAQNSWIGAILLAWSLAWVFKNKLKIKHVVLGILLLILTTSAWLPQMGRSPMEFKELVHSPLLSFSREDYLLELNQFPDIENRIDSLTLEKSTPDPGFVLARNIPRLFLNAAHNPQLQASFSVPETARGQHLQFIAEINNKIIAAKLLQPGEIVWQFPIDKRLLAQYPQQQTFKLQFKFLPLQQSLTNTSFSLTFKPILLQGYLQAPQTLLLDHVKPHCFNSHATKECILNVPATTQLLNLPVLYYPDLFSITLNGKSIPYQPVLYMDFPIVGITPQPGIINDIRIHFRGIVWANWLSTWSWLTWLACVFYCMMSKHFNVKRS